MDRKNAVRTIMFILPLVAAVLSVIYSPACRKVFFKVQEVAVYLNMPMEKANFEEENTTDKESTTENTINTTSATTQADEQSAEVANRFEKKELTETPSDIAAKQKEYSVKIKSETKKGDITEEPYLGGGKSVVYEGIKIQSKIPESFYKLDIKKLLSMGADLSIEDKSKPTVLIYHSHTTETYQMLDVGYYTTAFNQRSDDISRNMVRVGDEITARLEKAGFKVIHDRNIYDKNYNQAYNLSDKSVRKYLEQNPSIDVTIDVHRDAIQFDNGTKVKPTKVINGKKAAQIMIIPGCEYDNVKDFPDWEYNLRFALQVQQMAEKMYPGLMRPILFSARRYNLFETHNSILLEMGSDANTLDEACYSGRLIGEVLAKVLDKYVKG